MSQNIKRSLHCSFCDDEGHTINNCQDSHIDFLLKDFNESISLDIKCNFKMKYMNYVLTQCTVPEIKIIGYQVGLSMNKLSRNDFINDIVNEYYDKSNKIYYEIIDNMNDIELNYFAKKIAESSKKWNKRKISENRVRELLGIEKPEKRIVKVTKKSKENIRFTPIDDESDNNINYSDTDDSEYSDSQIQFYLFPLIDKSLMEDLPHQVQEVLEYFFILMCAFVISNLYVVITSEY